MGADDRTDVPTISDVARAAGVSTATVSRCLNSPDVVQAATRTRVMEAVESLGYTPNFGARGLRARRTFTIGAVIPTMENAIFARGLQAFQETLNENGVTLLVASSRYRQDLEERQIHNLIARGVDGLLLIGYRRSATIEETLRRRGVHSIIAWAYDEGSDEPAVGFDNAQSMANLAREVIARGHRRIAMISAYTAHNDRAADRVKGVRRAMTEAGLDPHSLEMIETAYNLDDAGIAFAKLMQMPHPPSVVMCGNDVLAVGAILEAKRLGLSVPEDVAVTGFDDIELASVIDPALTTVHVPHREMGRLAAEVLLSQISGGNSPHRIELRTSLVLRNSL